MLERPNCKSSINGTQRGIKVKWQKLGTFTSFNFFGAVVSIDVLKPEILSRTAQATAALTKLNPIWRDIEDIYFFEVNTKYISSNVLKISVQFRYFQHTR